MVRIVASARRHGIEDEDIRHALRNILRVYEPGDDVLIVIGPARNGEPLEIGVVGDEHEARIIHAMRARPKFRP